MKSYFILMILGVLIISLVAPFNNLDLGASRFATEIEQISFALKFGSGDFNPHYFIHPPFFAYVLCFFYGLFYIIGKSIGLFHSVEDLKILYYLAPGLFTLIARILVLLMAVFSILILYRMAKKFFDAKIALLSCILLTFSPSYIRLAHYASGDFPLLFVSLIAFYFILMVFERGLLTDYIFGGLFIGLSVATKYNGGMLLVPFLLAPIFSRRGILYEIKKIIIGSIFVIFGFFIGCPFALLDYKTFIAEIVKQFSRMNSENYQFVSWKSDKPGWVYLWSDTLPFAIGLIPTILLFASFIYSLFCKNKKIFIIFIFLLIYILYTGRWNVIKPRYYLFLFPYFAIIISYFLLNMLKQRRKIFLVLITIILMSNLISILKFKVSISEEPLSLMSKDWIEKNIPSNTKMAISDSIPLIPDESSIKEQLDEMKKKGYGEGVRLRDLQNYLHLFGRKYHVYLLPLPWMENYDPEDFDFYKLVNYGVRYFVISGEFSEYLLDPVKYSKQAEFFNNLQRNCALVKQFRQKSVRLEPESRTEYSYVLIYKYR